LRIVKLPIKSAFFRKIAGMQYHVSDALL
jgi:hypothetical protein